MDLEEPAARTSFPCDGIPAAAPHHIYYGLDALQPLHTPDAPPALDAHPPAAPPPVFLATAAGRQPSTRRLYPRTHRGLTKAMSSTSSTHAPQNAQMRPQPLGPAHDYSQVHHCCFIIPRRRAPSHILDPLQNRPSTLQNACVPPIIPRAPSYSPANPLLCSPQPLYLPCRTNPLSCGARPHGRGAMSAGPRAQDFEAEGSCPEARAPYPLGHRET
ncbi:hypothetical protein C8J57DRAFT_1239670 [Mycena rebaudengoi]|nr:hypothetical protein C8J57DRAFT_1239670 [Mycena rebaudengoi]